MVNTGVDAPKMLDEVLALGSTPCKKIIFMGSAGSLNEKINIGDIVIPEYSVSCVGADRYLTNSKLSESDSFSAKYYSDTDFSNKLIKVINHEIKNTDIEIHK